MFGTELRVSKQNAAMPSKTVRNHSLFPPHDKANVVSESARCAQDSLCADAAASSCVLYHRQQSVFTGFLFPHADFVQELAKLGYSADDGITNLMPFVAYCEDE